MLEIRTPEYGTCSNAVANALQWYPERSFICGIIIDNTPKSEDQIGTAPNLPKIDSIYILQR